MRIEKKDRYVELFCTICTHDQLRAFMRKTIRISRVKNEITRERTEKLNGKITMDGKSF